jgi:DNA-binding beta-propeller fold protein YncE
VLTSLPRVPRALLAAAAALSLVVVLSVPADARQGPPAHAAAAQRHEIWMLDQGTDLVHIVNSHRYEEAAMVDVSPAALREAGFEHAPSGPSTVPHMIDFDPEERYAFIAATAGGVTIIVDARTKQVVEVLPTGPGSHMAAVTPDGTAAWVAVIGSQQLIEIDLDLDAPRASFTIGRELQVPALLAGLEWEYPSASPVCHQFSPDSSEAWITLGPGWDQGGLVVLDLASGTLTHGFDPEVVRANCGVSVTEDRALANWSGQVVEGEDTPGETYVIDRRTRTLVGDPIDALGTDTHGLRLTPDGRHYWQVNRSSGDVVVIDADDLTVTPLDLVLDAPDILDFSPDGSAVYITQRGPTPRSGAIHAASGEDPGVAVVDAATGEVTTTLRPETVHDTGGGVRNDVHGVGVRTPSPGERGQAQAERVRRPPVVPARADADPSGFHCGLTTA